MSVIYDAILGELRDGNAKAIVGVSIDDTEKADGKVLGFNSTSGKLEYISQTSGAGSTDVDGGNFTDSYTASNDDLDGGTW